MTIIVGLVDSGAVYMGADSVGSNGAGKCAREDSKIFRLGEAVIGFTTSYRMGQLLRYGMTLPDVPDWDLDRYMAITFVDAVRATLKAGGWAIQRDGREGAGNFLVGIRGHLYTVWSDYSVERRSDGLAAVGSGWAFALGALHGTEGQMPVQRIGAALAAAERFDPSVGGPFRVEMTDSQAMTNEGSSQ